MNTYKLNRLKNHSDYITCQADLFGFNYHFVMYFLIHLLCYN